MTVASETTARTTLSSSEDRKKFHRMTDAFDHIDYHIPEKFTSCSSTRKRGIFFLSTRVLLMIKTTCLPDPDSLTVA